MVAMNQTKDSNVQATSTKDNKSDTDPSVVGCSSPMETAPTTPAITATFSDTATSTISASSTPQASPFSTPSSSAPSSPTSTPSLPAKESHPPKKSSKFPTKCPLEKCLLCTRDQPLCLMRSSTWPAIMRVVFYTLKFNSPEKEFFNLKDDVYAVMLFHWNKLAIHKKSASNWKKHIQDMLSHSKDIFESGLEIYGQNGYWRLKTNTDPWTLSGKTRRSPKKGLALKRPLEDNPGAEQMPRRPFIPYIAKGSAETSKFADTFQQPVSYVFINEHSSPPVTPQVAGTTPAIPLRRESQELSASGSLVPAPSSSAPNTPVFPPNPFSQRFTFVPTQFTSSAPQSPTSFPSSPQVVSPSLHSFINSRLAVSLPSSRLPSPQRSRSPSPVHTHSLPTSPRAINNPFFPNYSPFSAPASPSSSSRASPYVTQPSSASSTRPSSPTSLPMSPLSSPPPSPPSHRIIRALRSPSSPNSPISPLSPHQEDSALDSLRNTFEQFHWQTQTQTQAQAQAVHAQVVQAQAQAVQQAQAQAQSQLESHQIAFNLFASAKPANPCDVSFLLNE